MKRQLTPAQTMLEYFLHRTTEFRLLATLIDRARNCRRLYKRSWSKDTLKRVNFLGAITTFIIAHKDLAQPTAEELATLEHDLDVFRALKKELLDYLDT